MDLLLTTQVASAALCFFLAISLFSSRAMNPTCAHILGAIFLLLCTQHSLSFLSFSQLWLPAGYIRPCLAMLIAPAIYAYFLSALEPNKLQLKRLLVHALPSLAMVAVILLELWRMITPMIIMSFACYGTAMYLKAKKAPNPDAPIRQARPLAKRWLYILVAVMVINVVAELAIEWELRAGIYIENSNSLLGTALLFTISYLLSLVLVLTRAPLLEWMHELKHLPSVSKKPEPTQQELQTLFEQWQNLVAEKSLFMSENAITVSRAARLLGVPSRQLSQAINTLYGASFSQYLNDQRVERAKQLLLSQRQLAITEVYLEAGFSTKSHFHREFSRVTEMTPSEFRETAT